MESENGEPVEGALNKGSDFSDTLPIGTELGDYTILRVLGQGGFGVTYLAHDAGLDQDVVLWTSFVCRPSITNHPPT